MEHITKSNKFKSKSRSKGHSKVTLFFCSKKKIKNQNIWIRLVYSTHELINKSVDLESQDG